MAFLSPEVMVLLGLDGVILIFNVIAAVIAFMILRWFDIRSTTPLQYTLEKRSYLASVIVQFSLAAKILLFFFFVFTLDKLSNVIPGAMCAAGVVTASPYGTYLLILKLLGLYLFGFWIVTNSIDYAQENTPHTRFKFGYFLLVFFFLVSEFVVEILYFGDIDPSKIVSCCGVLFDVTRAGGGLSLALMIPTVVLVPLFYAIFVVMVIVRKKPYLFAFFNFLFLVVALTAIITFFSPYVYELPTHRCPFCLLQKGYYYMGYPLYLFLLVGTFFGMLGGFVQMFLKSSKRFDRFSLIFNALFVIMASFYPIAYYIKNGVWL